MFNKLVRSLLDNSVATIAAGVIAGVAVLNLVTFVVTDIMARLLESNVEVISGKDGAGYVTQIVLAAVLLLIAGYWFGRRLKR